MTKDSKLVALAEIIIGGVLLFEQRRRRECLELIETIKQALVIRE